MTPPTYHPADTTWLSACRFGLGFHWTAQTVPRHGEPLPFQAAVEHFDLPRFVAEVASTGADYVLFTTCHALQMMPGPHDVIDRLLPGRTTARDLLGELAEALAAVGVKLLLYYNHSCNQGEDPAWEQAVGYHGADKQVLAENLMAIVRWSGERYGARVAAWWFDSCYSVDRRGPHCSVSTDLGDWLFPWADFTVAAKAGGAERLVCYNAGVAETYQYTTHQDYWPGELVDLNAPPTSRFLPDGRQWFGWTCLDDRRWVWTQREMPISPPLYSDEQLLAYVRACRACAAPMTFNTGIYQDGGLSGPSLAAMQRLGAALVQG